MNAGSLELQLMANIARLQKDMDDAKRIVSSSMSDINRTIERTMKVVGGIFSAKMFADWIKGAIDAADAMDDLAEKSGIAVKALSAMRFAGEATGTPIESLGKGLQKLAVNMAAAAGGGKEQIAFFKTIGVEYKNFDGT
ncbi:MAG: hypothetical protein EOO22_14425, partial [Comamonadaceae bacterium]